jgi:cobaltochelatase CobN
MILRCRVCASPRSCGSATISRSISIGETVAGARLVIARLHRGSAYWPYGVERLVEARRGHGIPLALVPGDEETDRELTEVLTLPSDAVHRMWRYLVEGGPANAENLLRYAGSLIGCATARAEPTAVLRAGLYWPGRALPSLEEIAAEWRGDAGIVAIVFYRALVQSDNTGPVDALVHALSVRLLRPLPIFVRSLKDGEATALLGALFTAAPPAVILNATGFSVRTGTGGDPSAPADCPALQVVFAGNDEEGWRGGTRGLGLSDLAMNVTLPEIDGRILSRAVSFKAPLGRDPETEAELVAARRSLTASPLSPIRRVTGRACGRSRRVSAASR